MPIIEWSPEFSVNIGIIDEQHKKLVDTINVLHDAMKKGRSKNAMADVFDRLTEYTTTHFATEEQYMTKFSYPDYPLHKKEHDLCISRVSTFKEKFDTGKAVLSIELIMFLVDWLHKHLLDMDKKYSKFFNDKGLF